MQEKCLTFSEPQNERTLYKFYVLNMYVKSFIYFEPWLKCISNLMRISRLVQSLFSEVSKHSSLTINVQKEKNRNNINTLYTTQDNEFFIQHKFNK